MHTINSRKLYLMTMVLALLATWGLSPSVFAQEFNIFLGNTNSGSGPFSLRNSTLMGGSFEFPIWYGLSLEERVSYLTNFPEPTATNTKTGSVLADTNVNMNLPFRFFGLVPYVTIGMGFLHAVRNDPNNVGTNLDFNYGGGFKYLIPASPFGVRFDLRGHNFRNTFDKKNINTFEYTVGLLYRLRKG